jgi:predicted ATPase/DNA-binding XRE family transcriptional regulator
MKAGAPGSFGAQLKALREAASFTQEELATIAGLSVHAVSALERGERRRPQAETVRALSAALDLTGAARDALLGSARAQPYARPIDRPPGVALPLPPTMLVGREADERRLRQWLADPTARLITLIGPGGVGKSRLGLELARTIATEGDIRVVFVPLAAISGPPFVGPAIAEALGLTDVTPIDLPKRARAGCDGHATLLVLDNFEHVLEAAPLVADLLTSVPALRVLTTSRAPLHVRGEREYAVGPLGLEEDSAAPPPTDSVVCPAVRLFAERARDVLPGFHLTSTNGPIVTAICRRLDALPLAIELAAPWIKVLTPENLLRRLERDALLSIVSRRDLPERQQTMNATVAWSYQLLDRDEQRAFRCFGALPGLFPIDAAAAVLSGGEGAAAESDQALRATASLIDKSLLLRAKSSVVPTCPLYYMLETVRAYAALELAAAGERDDAMEGLVRYAITEASLAAEGLVGPAQIEWLDRVREDLETYRAALTWLIERGRSAEASDIAMALMFFWLIRGHSAEGLNWYEQILNLPRLPPEVESKMLTGAAVMHFTLGDLGHARAAINRSLELATSAGEMGTVALNHTLLGHVEHGVGNDSAARENFTRSIEEFRALAIPWGIGNGLTGLAGAVLASGDGDQTERLLDEATSVLEPAGPWFLSLALYVRAILKVRSGSPDEAISLMRESLSGIRDLHDKFAFVYALVPLAAAAALKGDDEWAAQILGARDAATERTGATVVDHAVRDISEQTEVGARRRLGPERWVQAYAAGRATSLDALLKDIERRTPRT